MRIVMLAQFYTPVIGGEERHVVTLSEALAARGHEVTVVSLAHPARPEKLQSTGVSIISVGGMMQRASNMFSDSERRHAPPFPDPELSYKLARIVGDLKPDIVHGHNWMSRSILPVKRLTQTPLVVTLHDYSLVCAIKKLMYKDAPCSGPRLRKCLPCATEHFGSIVGLATLFGNLTTSALERRAVDKYIAVSRAVALQCGMVEGDTPFEVLPTFISDRAGDLSEIIDDRVNLLPQGDFMLYVGDLAQAKGVDVLLAAYCRLVDPPPLVLIGRRCVSTPAILPPNVTLHESWPHHAVMHAWSRCLFGIAPSVWAEACGTIVMEANAVGKTMIASDIGGLSDLVDQGRTGLLVAPGDADALATAMRSLITNPAMRESMGVAGRRHVERFMAKSIVPQIENVYRDVLQGSARSYRYASSDALAGGHS